MFRFYYMLEFPELFFFKNESVAYLRLVLGRRLRECLQMHLDQPVLHGEVRCSGAEAGWGEIDRH